MPGPATPDSELVIDRVVAAPRSRVYRAFVEPDLLARWFGPAGFSVPRESVSVDARVGGHQRLTLVSEDDPARSSPVDATFTEVVEGELLVGTEQVGGIPGVEGELTFTLRVEFHDEPRGGTRVLLRQGPYTQVMEGLARQGWLSSFAKLDDLLAR
jgi:uncharacterized protein YndB with AHSA1/START domain